jgi:hypothetical protein
VDIVKTATEWLQLPHWLMIAGTSLAIAGLIGLVISRRQQAKVQDDPATEPRAQLPPLPDFLDSRPSERTPPGPPPVEPGLNAKGK